MAKVKKAAKPAKKIPDPEPAIIEEKDWPIPDPGGERYGARASQAKVCAFCKHEYLNPCNVKTKDKCPNYIHLQGSKKK